MTSTSLLTSLLQDYQSAYAASSTAPGTAATATSAASSTSTTDASSLTGSSAGNFGDAYVLDLSQAAQDIVDNQNSTGKTENISLTDAQKQKLQSILDKYKDAPVDSDTLSALNNDLQEAGLAPDELASTQQAIDYDPKSTILQILGFGDPNATSSSSSNDGLSGLSSAASGTPIGDLLQQYASNSQTANGSTDSSNSDSSNTDDSLSNLNSTASDTPISDLLQQYASNAQIANSTTGNSGSISNSLV